MKQLLVKRLEQRAEDHFASSSPRVARIAISAAIGQGTLDLLQQWWKSAYQFTMPQRPFRSSTLAVLPGRKPGKPTTTRQS